mmetsp:Transcript_78397/g.210410  ORF Transcript_78397/g.210410 Transcript_78397/m.210410 type:complete len:782 (+) Transcript_78397:227-2572(+)
MAGVHPRGGFPQCTLASAVRTPLEVTRMALHERVLDLAGARTEDTGSGHGAGWANCSAARPRKRAAAARRSRFSASSSSSRPRASRGPARARLEASSIKAALSSGCTCPSSSAAADFSNAMSDAENTMKEYTTIEGVSNLLSGGASSIFSSITSYFQKVCVTQCGVEFDTDNSGNYSGVTGAREYVYEPSADKVWASVWAKVVAATATGEPGDTLRSVFKFDALSSASCPYDEKYCVPLPGVSFSEVSQGYCTFEVESGLFSSISSAAASTFDSVMSSEVASSVQSGIGESFATFLETWDVTIIVCVLAFVMGLVFLVLLRFFIKPVVWIAVFSVFALFMALGVLAYLYSYQCMDDALDSSALVSATSSDTVECLDYKVSSEDGRTALLYCAYICWVLAGVYAGIMVCLFKRIRLAVAINSVAAQFVVHTPHVVLVPVIQGLSALIWTVIWILMCTYLLSQVPDDYVDTTTAFDSYDKAYASCVDGMWPEGGLYLDGESGAWMCYQPRYAVDYRFWFSVFSFFWHHAFMVAVGQCTIAGAVGVWFFTRGEKSSTSRESVSTGVHNCFRYHLGSLAFGSFILAVIQTIRWFMIYLSKQAKAQGNRVMECVLKIFAYCLWCFEKSVKFLNKNAYIQIALLATNFCVSAKNAFWLIARNAVRFGVLGSLGFIVHLIGKYLIMTATAVLGFLILEEMHSDVAAVPVVCVLVYCVIGYTMGVLFMDVFGLAVDATLQCFIATEEMGIDNSFIPAKLKKFVTDTVESGDNQEGKHESCCACCAGCCS